MEKPFALQSALSKSDAWLIWGTYNLWINPFVPRLPSFKFRPVCKPQCLPGATSTSPLCMHVPWSSSYLLSLMGCKIGKKGKWAIVSLRMKERLKKGVLWNQIIAQRYCGHAFLPRSSLKCGVLVAACWFYIAGPSLLEAAPPCRANPALLNDPILYIP